MRKTPSRAPSTRRNAHHVRQPSALLMRLIARANHWLWDVLSRVFGRWWGKKAAVPTADHRRMHFENLEPRLLMSADVMPVADVVRGDPTIAAERSTMQTIASAAIATVQRPLAVTPAATATATAVDADGTTITATITGPGVVELIAQGSGYALSVGGTDATSALAMTASGGDGRAKLVSIDAPTPLASASLGVADLTGSASFSAVQSLTLGDITGASITNGFAGAASFSAGHVRDLRLSAPQANLSVTVTDWTASAPGTLPATSVLSAAGLARLTTTGDFSADLRLSGTGITGSVLGTVDIGGHVAGGTWMVVGRSNSITAGVIDGAWRGQFTDTVTQLASRGDLGGFITVGGTLSVLQAGGSLRGATLLVGANLGSDSVLGGSGAAADSFKAGTLGRLRVVGDMVDSRITVGLDPVNGVLFDGNDVLLGTGANRVQELRIGGRILGTSLVIAPAYPASVFINGASVAPATVSQLFTRGQDLQVPQLSASLLNDTGTAGDGITSDAGIKVTAVDAGGVVVLQARIGAGAFQPVAYVTRPDGSLIVSPAALAGINGGSLPDGAYSVELRALDAANNVSNTVTVAFTLDTTAPTGTVQLAPGSDTGTPGDNITTASSVTLQGSTAAGTGVALSGPGGISASTTAAADRSFSFGGVALALGDNAFTFTLTDAAGNTATLALTVKRENPVVVDTEAPIVTAALVTDSGRSGTDGITNTVAFAGTAADNIGVTQLLVRLDATTADAPFFDITAQLANGNFTIPRSLLDTLAGGTLAAGAHTLQIVALDAAGNRSTTHNRSFTLDTTAPAFSDFGLSASDASNAAGTETGAATVQLKGTAEAGATVTLAGQNLSVTAGAGGAFVMPGVSLALGANVLTLTATDAAGNATSITRTITRTAAVQIDPVLEWNNIALRAVQLDVTDPPVATRTLAMVSLAQYDTLAAIEGTPAYLVQRSINGPVSAQAAAAVAAHRVLSTIYPAQKAVFDAALAADLAAIADGQAKDQGITLGLAVADAVVALRANDGSQNFVAYDGSTSIGQWRPTGPMFDVADDPQWGTVTPFALSSPSQFRPSAPPALDSAAYAASVEEVKRLGSATSGDRTADQTQIALFWADGKGSYTPPGHWNQIATDVARAKGNSLAANARLFAQLNVALADTAIACWDAKYTYGLWRPETAIQNADLDNNAATTVDSAWRPLLLTPPHPEYVSGHSSFSMAAATVLGNAFGDATAFSTTGPTLPGTTRSYSSFTEAAQDAGRSRVYGGIHYEFTNQAGQVLGRQVAGAVLQRFALTQDTQAPNVVMADTPVAVKANPTITGQVLDNLSGVAAAKVRIDNGTPQALVLDADGRFSITTTFASDGSVDGVHTVTVTATDAAGNISAGTTRSFTLDTRAPALALPSLADGDALTAASRIAGMASPTGTTLTQLSYRFDNGSARSLVFDATAGTFDEALAIGRLDVGNHTLELTARDAAGNVTTLTRNVKIDALAPPTVTSLTPADGSGDVGVTVRPQIRFSRPVNAATLNDESFYATGPDGSRIAATIVPSNDGTYAWLFFTNPMPGGSQVTLHVDGSKIRGAADGSFLDADGNGTAGGALTQSFTTVSRTAVTGTTLTGKVVDPGPDLEPMSFDDIRRGPDGIIHTADDVFLLPIANAKVYILGQEDRFVFTDANGNFTLTDVPAGTVKVAVDGRTATNAPSGVFFPEMVMDVELRPGVANTLMGGMGSTAERLANIDRQEVYLPRVPTNALQQVSNTAPTVITVTDAKSAPQLTEQERAALTLTVNPGSAIGENGQVLSDVKVGVSTVPAELVRDMLPPGVLQHTFDITIQAPGVATFAEPVQITFPNVFNAAPGTKLNILSFDHTTGMLVINGTATVSADGLAVVSDSDSGIRAPGWHGMAPAGTQNDPVCPPTKHDIPVEPILLTDGFIDRFFVDDAGTFKLSFANAASKVDPQGDPCSTQNSRATPLIVKITVDGNTGTDHFLDGLASIQFSLQPQQQKFIEVSVGDLLTGAGLDKAAASVLYGAKITVECFKSDESGAASGKSLKTEEAYVYRLFDSGDGTHTDGQIDFERTFGDGSGKAAQAKPYSEVMPPAAKPNYMFTSTGAASGNEFRFAPDNLVFDPKAGAGERTDAISIIAPSGKSVGQLKLAGAALGTQNVLFPYASLKTAIAQIADSPSAALNTSIWVKMFDPDGTDADPKVSNESTFDTRVRAIYDQVVAKLDKVNTANSTSIFGKVGSSAVDALNIIDSASGDGILIKPKVVDAKRFEALPNVEHNADETGTAQNLGGLTKGVIFVNVDSMPAGNSFKINVEEKSRLFGFFYTTLSSITVNSTNGGKPFSLDFTATTSDVRVTIEHVTGSDKAKFGVTMYATDNDADALTPAYAHWADFGKDDLLAANEAEMSDQEQRWLFASLTNRDPSDNPDGANAVVEYINILAATANAGTELGAMDRFTTLLANAIAHEVGHDLGAIHLRDKAKDYIGGDVMGEDGSSPAGLATFVKFKPLVEFALGLPVDVPSALDIWQYYKDFLPLEKYRMNNSLQVPGDSANDLGVGGGALQVLDLVPSLDTDWQTVRNVLFADQVVDGVGGASQTKSIILFNAGDEDLEVVDVSLSNGQSGFSIEGLEALPVSIEHLHSEATDGALASKQIVIRFDPSVVGSAEDILRIRTDSRIRPYVEIPLSGTAVSPFGDIRITRPVSNLGGQALDAGARLISSAIVVRNDGRSELRLIGIDGSAAAGAMEIVGSAAVGAANPIVLRPGESRAFDVRFDPSQIGLVRGEFAFRSDDPDQPVSKVVLVGTGTGNVLSTLDWGNDFVAIDAVGVTTPALRATSSANGAFSFVLPQRTTVHTSIFDPVSGLLSQSYDLTAADGAITQLAIGDFLASTAPDSDGDGLPDDIEFTIGTNQGSGDTDKDGLDDFTEVRQGLDPLGGLNLRVGVVAAVSLLGSSDAIATVGAIDGTGAAVVLVASGTQGLAVVDASTFRKPRVLAQLDLAGTNVDVAVDNLRGVAAVAGSDAGLHLVDFSRLSAPSLLRTIAFDGPVTSVVVQDGFAYAVYGTRIASVDVNTGDIRQTLDLAALGGGTLTHIAVDGSTLYTMDSSRTLRTISINGDLLTPRDSLVLTNAGGKLFVGGGVAYIGTTTDFTQGFSTVNVADPADIKLLSGIDAANVAGQSIAATGSGLLVNVGNLRGQRGDQIYALDVLNVTDPANTGAIVTRINLPSAPKDIALANGLAFVADGSGGLQIVNYAGFDTKGVAPTVSITADAIDADPATPGTQVLEGRSVRILPTIRDDVQVRNVELLVNGQVVTTDVAFPWELFAQAPTIASGGNTMTIQVRATDTGGNVGLSNVVTLNLVPDTFPPQVASVSVDEGARRFFVRSIDIVFDEPLDVARLATGGVQLVRAGGDGLFRTADDVAVPVRLDTRSFGQSLSVLVDSLLPPGDYRLTIAPTVIADRAGNALAAPIIRNFSIRPASDVKAASGVPETPTAPSANPGQQIGVAVPFDPATARGQFKVVGFGGLVSTRVLTPVRTDPARGIAYFTVPLDAVTGDAVVYSQVGTVRTDFPDGTFPLQILPTILDVQVQSVAADGSTATVVINGLGFVEGNNSEYRFGSTTVVDAGPNTGPSVSSRFDPVVGSIPNGAVTLTVPLNAGSFGAINVKTAGGTSASYTVNLASITSVALSGTPADAALASANAGQAITLVGSGLTTSTDVLLRWTDVSGNLQMTRLSPVSATTDGTRATLLVPADANGVFGLQVLGSASQPVLQIVPTLSSADFNGRFVLYGSGLVEAGSSYTLPGASLTDAAVDGAIDVYYSRNFSAQNGSVSISTAVLPTFGAGSATVTTAGGTSAPVAVNLIRPTTLSGNSLGDVAVNAAGELWISDSATAPGHLLRIDPATGQTLQTITLSTDFGSTAINNFAGLQVLSAAMTLGSAAVPAGSLLVFNGAASPDRVVAVNPVTGAVIASLTLGADFTLTGAAYDAASNRIFLTEQNSATGNAIVAVSATTGTELARFTAPFNIQSWSGLAIDPASGHLWLGAISGGPQLVEYLVGADGTLSELRRLDTRPQGLDGNEISGLHFGPDGKIYVSSTQGWVYRIDPTLDAGAVRSASLTQVIGTTISGTAAQAGVAAANAGQVIELVGTNFGTNTQVLFNIRDGAGNTSVASVTPLAVNAQGTRLQVQVPALATTGAVRVVNQGSRDLGFTTSYNDAIYRGVTVSFTAGSSSAAIRFGDGGLQGIFDESWGIDNVTVRQGSTTVFSDNFESGAADAAWTSPLVNSEARSSFSRFSGRFSNGSQTLNLSGLTAGQTYTLGFDLYVLDSWEGSSPSSGPDQFEVSVDGTSVLRESFANLAGTANVQTFGASAGIALQIVPTLTAMSGRPGDDTTFTLTGSGFMEGASTISVGGVAFVDANNTTSPFDVTGSNSLMTLVAPRTLDGPVRITTAGGYAELAGPAFAAQPPSLFTAIVASATAGVAANPALPSAVTGQTIVLQGQGFSSASLVQFQGIDDTGRLGTLTTTGTVGGGGTTLSVVVPALARTGTLTVLGSGTSLALQIVPTLRSLGGTVAAGNTLLLDGSGLTANDLIVSVDGRPAGSFSVRTLVDGQTTTADQQLLQVVVPNAAANAVVTVSTAGGSFTLRRGVTLTTNATLAPVADVGDTLATATDLGLAIDRRQAVTSTIGTTGTSNDVDLYRLELNAGDILSLSMTGSAITTRLRVFDAAGTQLSAASLASATAPIAFTAPAGGSYYIGISASANTGYNPAVAGSGTAGTAGAYQLNIDRLGAGSSRIAGITATAASGTPAQVGTASANTGQTLTLSGTFATGDTVVFTTLDTNGNLGETTVTPATLDVAGGTLTVVVPANATTGRVRLARDAAGVMLQVVPTVSDVVMGAGGTFTGGTLTLSGSGFAEGAMAVLMGDQRIEDIGRGFGIDVFSTGSLNLTVPDGMPTGPIRVSTAGGTSAALGLAVTGITASANSGAPANGAQASANPGQAITLNGSGLDATTDIVFRVVDGNGTQSDLIVKPSTVNAGGTQAQVVVPANAITGAVRVVGDSNGAAIALQILPTILDVQVQSVAADGSTATVVINGLGFVEGNNSEYRFGSTTVVDAGPNTGPSVSSRFDPVVGSIPNGAVTLTVPLNAGSFGAINVKTAGGTSASYTVNLASITSVALSGTPADAALASANAGQAITLVGSGLTTSTDVLLRWTDVSGNLQMTRLSPVSATTDGTRATLLVPADANGVFGLQVLGSASQPVLQIVPTLSSADFNGRFVLYGSGLVEAGSSYTLPGASLTDAAVDGAIDVYYSRNFSAQNGSVSISTAVLPTFGAGSATVTTAGGTSAPVAVNLIRPTTLSGNSLGDVAVNAAGELWISDSATAPGHLLRIDPATGQTLQTITLSTDFGSTAINNFAGLQVLSAAMTLGSAAVPAGSLLVFNGAASPDRVVAVNPVTGAVIASLTLGADFTLTGAAYDAASNRIFLTEQNSATGNAIVAVSATTGTELARFTAPFNIQSWSGLAIDPASGHLWLGAISGGPQLVEYLVGADGTLSELRRLDTRPQGLDGNEISGLHFGPDGKIYVSSTQGWVYRIDPTLDAGAVRSASLTQVIGTTISGTAAQAGVAAANAGQVIELVGTNFGTNTQVLFNIRDGAGNTSVASVTPLAVNAQGTRLQVQVPALATTGAVRVVNQGSRDLGFTTSYNDAIYRGVTVSFTAGSSSAAIRFGDGGLQGIFDESWGIDNVTVRQGSTTVFSDNFESGAADAAWTSPLVNSEARSSFSRFSGRFSNGSQTLNLSGLTAGQTYTLGFDLYVLDSWEGSSPSSGPDQFEVSVDGTSVLRESFANLAGTANVQTFGASAGIALQIVPTLTAMSGRPGDDTTFTLTGSGFMEGASTISVGGVAFVDANNTTSPFDVTGSNSLMTLVAPRTLDGPVRITTAGGYAELAGPAFAAQPPSLFTAIVASATAGVAANPALPSAVTGQTIVLQGQGFSSASLVQFQGIDDTGRLGTLTTTGTVGGGGTTLSVVVPALARTGTLTVLGSGTSLALQIVPTLRSLGGTVAAGNTLLLDGSGLTANDLIVSVDGRPAGSFSVRTLVDGQTTTADQQLLQVVVPNAAANAVVTVSTAGGSFTLRRGVTLTTNATLAPVADVGDTLATATDLGLAIDRRQAVTSTIGTTGTSNDVDLYRLELNAGDILSLSMTGSAITTRLRVFDAAGTQLSAASLASATAPIAFTAPAGGSYYIGISASANTGYNPAVAGSGTAGTAGAYQLNIDRLGAGSSRIAGITATAASGTPAQVGTASANTGQTLTLSGTFATGDTVVFTTLDTNGNLGETTVTPATLDVAGGTLTVVVPANATTGRVRLARDAAGVMLQVVPTVSDVVMGAGGTFTGGTLTLSGSGFAEGAMAVLMGDQRIEDIGRGFGIDVFSTGSLNLTVPDGMPTGPIRVSTAGGTSAALGLAVTGITASANSGAPANGAQASANPGQAITLNGSGLDATTDIVFRVVDGNGTQSDLIVKPSTVNAGGTQAQVVVPANAITGAVRVVGDSNGAAIALQILPTILDVQVQSVAADGSTATVVINGLGFVEGNNSEYRFGSTTVVDAGPNTGPSVSSRFDPVVGSIPNGAVTLTVPLNAGSFGAINVKTAGGTSASYTVNLASITSVALSGTPADAALASANAGQAITLVGSGLTTSTDVLLRWTDVSGNLQMTRLSPVSATTDGTRATLLVPADANGVFGLQVLGSASQPVLQIVPTLSSADFNGRFVLYGSGLVEAGSSYTLPGASLTDAAVDGAIDVYYSRNFSAQNGSVSISTAVLPTFGAGSATVTTAGGTSAPVAVNLIRPTTLSGNSLGDVAVNAAGELWISDSATAPGHLLRIDPATGQTLQTITLSTDFGSTAINNFAGLQVLSAAMTLGSAAVPAGSLLVFNGAASPDRVVAVNPVTGAVIASLTLGADFTLTGAAYDAASNRIFLTEQNSATGNAIVAVSATTGTELARFTAPFNIQSWSGLAIDPASGHLWLGAISGGPQLVEYLVGADGTLSELRRLDTRPQGLDGNEISGLHFGPDGKIYVSSTQGWVYRIDPTLDAGAVRSASLTQVIGTTISGTAAQAGVAAANAGQVIELVGTNFGTNTQVLFNIRDGAGNTSVASVTPLAVNAQGTRLQVQVPLLATSGDIRVVNSGINGLNLGFAGSADAIYRNVTASFVAGADTAVLRFADGGLQGINDESWGIDNVVVRQGSAIVFRDDFEGGAKAGWSSTATDTSERGVFSQFSGRFSNGNQSLSLTGLTTGQTYTVSFDLYVIDSWDGNYPFAGPDVFQVSADGVALLRESFANVYDDARSVQTFGASAGVRLQVVPTLASINGVPGQDNTLTLTGSGFMEGASTISVGGVSFVDANNTTTPFDVTGNNAFMTLVAPRTLDGPVRITTEGGFSEIAGFNAGTQPLVGFAGISALASSGTAADAALPSAVTGQNIVITGQGLTNSTLVQFQGIDDTGRLGTLTRTGTVSNGGTTLTVEVPALARSGAVTVLGSGTSIELQVVPTLRAAGGSATPGSTMVIEGTGLTANDLTIQIDGRGVGSFTVRTLNDGPGTGFADQQLLTLTVPPGVSAGVITVSTAGGSSTLRLGAASITALPALTPATDIGDTLATALNPALGINQSLVINGTIASTLDVDLVQVQLTAGDVLTIGLTGMSSRLRVFDALGNQLATQAFAANGTAALRFVAPGSGTFFLGVGGANNTNYNPNTANSGTASTTGSFSLAISRLGAGSSRIAQITTTAASGTPANAAIASANTGQVITLSGAGFAAGDQVVFTTIDDFGRLSELTVNPTAIAPDGSSITVTVPTNATTGRVRLAREVSGTLLQIVPTLASGTRSGTTYTLTGTGFPEGMSALKVGSRIVSDYSPSVGFSVSVGTMVATMPDDLVNGPVTIITAGGSSSELVVP